MSHLYTGKDTVMEVGNGNQLSILYIGSISLQTIVGIIIIPNVLYVLGLCKNLLSIHSLTKDFNYFLVFDDFGFTAKAKESRRVLLCCRSREGLYHLAGTAS